MKQLDNYVNELDKIVPAIKLCKEQRGDAAALQLAKSMHDDADLVLNHKKYDLNCISCGKKLETEKNDNIINGWIDDAIVETIQGGYGSKYDTDQFVIGICDNCITEKLKTNQIAYK